PQNSTLFPYTTLFRSGEIDIFENAEARFLRLEGEQALDTLGRDDDHLAGLQIADETRPDDIQSAGLGGEDPCAVEVAQHQRADADRKSTRLNSSHVKI